MRKKSALTLDFTIILGTIALIVIGVLFIYSSGISSTGIIYSREYIRQIIWAGSGVVLMILFALLDYTRLKPFSLFIYAFFILLLIITLLFGTVVNGARSWLGILDFGIQPSEFMKIATIIFLSAYYANSGKRVDSLPQFFVGLGIILVPIILILLQPDMGTALVYIPIFLVVTFIAGVKLRYLVFIFIAGLVAIVLATMPYIPAFLYPDKELFFVQLISDRKFLLYSMLVLGVITFIAYIGSKVFKNNYFYWISFSTLSLLFGTIAAMGARIILKGHQIMRLIVFLNPEVDPQGAGWHIIQSLTAVGSGGFVGKGFLQGTQSHYQYLPQQSTDFIFSIIAEEWGFFGVLVVFALMFFILVRATLIIMRTKDRFGIYMGSGIVGMIFFHFVINIGMAVGIMPITGIPLFFLSYGGSSLWTGMIGIGIILSMHRKKETF
jgi:rod shape determining protein RodA